MDRRRFNSGVRGHDGSNAGMPPKHGAYSPAYLDKLTDEERQLLESVPDDPEEQLMQDIGLLAVRERRIMDAINRYTGTEAFASRSVTEGIDRETGEMAAVSRTTVTENGDRTVLRLEQELSSVQRAKGRLSESLGRLRLERQRFMQEEAGDSAVDDWIAAVTGGGNGDEA